MALAKVSKPTGPPLKRSIKVLRYLISTSSRPIESTFKAFNALIVSSKSIESLPSKLAKSLTLLYSLLAILGVPLLRLAIYIAPSKEISVFNTREVLKTISLISSSV